MGSTTNVSSTWYSLVCRRPLANLDVNLDEGLRLLRMMITATSTMPQPTASETRMDCSHALSKSQLCPKWARVCSRMLTLSVAMTSAVIAQGTTRQNR